MKIFYKKNVSNILDDEGQIVKKKIVSYYISGAEIPRVTVKSKEIYPDVWNGKQFNRKVFSAAEIADVVRRNYNNVELVDETAGNELVTAKDYDPNAGKTIEENKPKASIPKSEVKSESIEETEEDEEDDETES